MDGAGAVLGSLSITAPKFRFDRAKTDRFAALLRNASARFAGGGQESGRGA
jgi:DNA-binding IclR family transcriptional regulator